MKLPGSRYQTLLPSGGLGATWRAAIHCATGAADAFRCRWRVIQFLTVLRGQSYPAVKAVQDAHMNKSNPPTRPETACEEAQLLPARPSWRRRGLRALARAHAAHARPSRRHHAQSLHLVELQDLGRQGAHFLGTQASNAGTGLGSAQRRPRLRRRQLATLSASGPGAATVCARGIRLGSSSQASKRLPLVPGLRLT